MSAHFHSRPSSAPSPVMPGLVPGIHAAHAANPGAVDCRDKPGNDEKDSAMSARPSPVTSGPDMRPGNDVRDMGAARVKQDS